MKLTTQKQLDALCQRFSRRPLVGSLALRVRDGDGDEWAYPHDDDRMHLIASVTKTFFATIALQLVREGLLELDQPAAHYLPPDVMTGLCVVDGVDYSDTITVSQLLSHRSGIPDYYSTKRLNPRDDIATVTAADPGWSAEEALSIARSLPGAFRPGTTKSHYSFTNYQLVGQVMSHVTGRGLADVLDQRISTPLGLTATTLLGASNLEVFAEAEPVLYDTQRYQGARRMASLAAEGAMVSSTADVMVFLDALISGVLVPKEDWAMMRAPVGSPFPRVGYGHGVMTLTLPRVFTGMRALPPLVGHTGATGFFMWVEPYSGVRIVGSVNQLAKPLESVRFLATAAKILLRSH